MAINVFWGNIFKLKAKTSSLPQFFKTLPLFEGFNKRELKNIEKLVHIRHFKKDEIIFKEDEPGIGMYIIRTGAIRIVKQRNNKDGSIQEEVITKLLDKDFFGELNLVERTSVPRTASAYADKESQLIGIFRPDLLDLMERNPRLGLKIFGRIAEIIGARLRITTSKLTLLKEELRQIKEKMPAIDDNLAPL